MGTEGEGPPGLNQATLEWTVHPFRARRGLGLSVLGAIALLSVGAGLVGRAWFWGIFSFVVLFLSVESFYFPTRFALSAEKLVVVRRFSRNEREWGAFRRCLVDSKGITLSPFSRSSWLEAYRAIRLRVTAENRDTVLRFLRERLGSQVEWVDLPARPGRKGDA
jgi:hypothetical protein